jgi:predicted nuclease of predicted toxin-antitoxin system
MPPASDDYSVLDAARQAARVLITQDLDFSSLLALGGHSSPSVLTVRLPVPEPLHVADRLLEALPTLASDLQAGCIAVLEERAVRVRLLPVGREP